MAAPLLRFIVFTIISLSCFVVIAQEWQRKKSDNNVAVYLEDSDSALKAVKAEVTVTNASVYALVNLLRDTDNVTEWMDSVKKVQLLQQDADDTDIVATFLNVPWPFSDRVMVTRSHICIHDNRMRIRIEDALDVPFEEQDHVRMTDVSGLWTVTAQPDNKLHISYTGRGDPGGSIPNWLTRSKLVRSTFETFSALKQKIVETKYQGKPLGYKLMLGSSACDLQDSQK
jgi:hypothetical protein